MAVPVFCRPSRRRSPKNRLLSANVSDYAFSKYLKCSRCPSSMRQKSAPQICSTFSSSTSSSSNSSVSSIEKVEDLARRLQQYHIAQRRARSADAAKEHCAVMGD
ncbi:hypothetical protein lerEdw1_016564 [Lerista edwardsae]|nr:hypothetical protein lerEdw1_016564 [Lerista edwardsae]